ncbi:ycf20-like protein isoform X2 [Phragmites australis]|uniref:ycf20-like protein isoform X2 n=1 Tax=Phragmites australis TaxID=29695 RepID=UPI002D765590|nr:ycf20-like protein isoform X2 [Phragmites australis]
MGPIPVPDLPPAHPRGRKAKTHLRSHRPASSPSSPSLYLLFFSSARRRVHWVPPEHRAEPSHGTAAWGPSLHAAGAGRWALRRRPRLRAGAVLRTPPPGMLPAAAEREERRGYQTKNCRWRPALALETGGSPNTDGQDFEEDSGFLGRTRLGRLIQAAARELLEKLNSARTNSPTKIFLVLLGFYTANALATILGQTGDWDVLVAGVVVTAIEGIGMLMYRKPIARPPGRLQSLIAMVNYWKAGVCLGLFVDAFKLGS